MKQNFLNRIEEFGKPMFDLLFDLEDEQLKKIIFNILGTDLMEWVKQGKVIKKIINNIPSKIEICRHNCIEINYFGILYVPKNGRKIVLKEFDNDFKLLNKLFAEDCRYFDEAQGRNKCTHREVNIKRCLGICEKFEQK